MKKHELIKMAYDKYPKGTEFLSALDKCKGESLGEFKFSEASIGSINCICKIGEKYVYHKGKWAEIVNPKIAVKVENEKEFKALMKHYDSLGYVWANGAEKASSLSYELWGDDSDCNALVFGNDFTWVKNSNPEYQIIPFSDFAKEHNIKLPLLISEDGVDLYEGDYYACIKNLHNTGWMFCYDNNPLMETHFVITDSSVCKAFSTKQAALDWIEAQKPKEKYLHIGENTLTITSDAIKGLENIAWLGKDDVLFIHKTMQELS